MAATVYRIFVTIAPGLEDLLQEELAELELPAIDAMDRGGLQLAGGREVLWRIALGSRLAEGLRIRLGHSFRAATFRDLKSRLSRLPWAAFAPRGCGLPRVRVSTHKSRLYHSGAVAERTREVLDERLGCEAGAAAGPDVYVRIVRDRVQVSVDAAGERLHRRGYREEVAAASVRETLAAACLRLAGVRRGGAAPVALWDPFCGAGTIPLEARAALDGRLPGAQRRFALEQWPTHDAATFAAFKAGEAAAAEGAASAPAAVVVGSDRSAQALEAARANAARAALPGAIQWLEGDLEAAAASVPEGAWVVANPPYGHRLRGDRTLRDTYRRLGDLLRRRADLRPAVVLIGNPRFEADTRLPWERALRLTNQGLAVRALRLPSR